MNFLKLKPVIIISDFVNNGHERSVKAKKNIISSLLIRIISILISFITLPITLNYVDSSAYGIWLTLSSIVAWFAFFDIGLTQGLRNKFAEALAKGNDNLAQIYVSTTYAILSIVFVFIWLVFLIANNFLDWSKILNVTETIKPEVTTLAIIVFTYFCLSFVLKIITTILLADQQPAKSSLIDLFGQAISLIIILILVKTTSGSLVKLGIALCISPLVVLVAANIVLFKGKYRRYTPSISHIKFSHVKDLFNLGLVFFIIQLAGIVQFQTANIIIARNFSTADVTAYNIVYKYFGILLMVNNIFLTPFWSASTEAYHKGDLQWIKNGIRRYNQLNLLLLLGGIIMLVLASPFYRIWLGEGKVAITFILSLWGFVFYSLSIYGGKYVSFLNGISALRIQFIASIFSPFVYIAAALLLIKHFHLGVPSLFIASIIANFNGFILAPLQYSMVVNKSKNGIWIR